MKSTSKQEEINQTEPRPRDEPLFKVKSTDREQKPACGAYQKKTNFFQLISWIVMFL